MSVPPSTTRSDGLTPRAVAARVWAWRHDAVLAKLYANVLKLFTGHVFSAIVGLGAIWFATAGLGLLAFGILVTTLSFTHLIGNALKFSTWEAVVKYGADDLAREDNDAFKRLIAFGTLLDLGTAVAALLVCAGLTWLILPVKDVTRDYLPFVLFMSLSAFFTVSATPVGILRLFDKFGIQAVTQPIGPGVRVALCAVCFWQGWDLWAFGAAYLASSAVDRAVTVWLGWRELAKRGLAPGWSHFLASKTAGHRGIWKFALSNNARISLAVVAKEADDLIVAAFLGATGVALWKIVKQVSSVLGVPAKLFVYSVFPQLARMWSAGDYRGFRSLVLRGGAVSTVGAVGVVVVYALWGPALLDLFFFRATQKDFVAAFEPGLLFLCSRVITMFASPFMPALTAMGRAYRNLKLAFIMTCVTVPVLILATWQFGLVGAAWSRIFTEALSCAVFGAVVMRAVDSRIRRAAAAPPV